jgi:poly(3-hydroxybutyrate) depolymerase
MQNSADGQPCDSSTCPSDSCKAQTGCNDAGSCDCEMRRGRNCNWCGCLDDVAFVARVLTSVDTEACIDPARRFASGYSMGGMFTNYLMSRFSGTFAAFVIVAGLNPRDFFEPPPSTSTAGTLFIHGVVDPTVPHDGKPDSGDQGYWYETVWDESDRLARVYGCSTPETAWAVPDGVDPPAKAEVICYRHEGCRDAPRRGERLGYCLWKGDHRFPKGWGTDLMWTFMKMHSDKSRVGSASDTDHPRDGNGTIIKKAV